MKPVVVIPAYNPDEKLITLVGKLRKSGLPVVVVDDGSEKRYQVVFDILAAQHYCEIRRHDKNLGKGAALKTGMKYGCRIFPGANGVITADADGQHRVVDILNVAHQLEKSPNSFILGVRSLKGKTVPFKSKWGNRITSWVYFLSTGQRCRDTQTGLRGIPRGLVDQCLAVAGERYEYEMNLLLMAGKTNMPIIEIPIETIYIENNQSSHFHPIRDSITIYFNIIKFSFSSLLAAAADLTMFTLLVNVLFNRTVQGILVATVLARLLSGVLNFMMNKHFVFRSKESHAKEARNYLILFCAQMLLSWGLVSLMSFMPFHLTFIKIAVDGTLFFASYQIQKRYIFKRGGAKDEKIFLKTV